jgi:hypothetical protein
MFPFTRSVRPARAPVRRTILTLDRLDDRWMPDATPTPAPAPTSTTTTTATVAPPQITAFDVEQVGPGRFLITGQVVADDPDCLLVSFDGAPGCIQGTSTLTNSDGSFSMMLYTTPSDYGTITAQVVDQYGQESNIAYAYLPPTGPAPPGGPGTV